jgi:hypothetical protein
MGLFFWNFRVKCMSGPWTCQEVSLRSTNSKSAFLGPCSCYMVNHRSMPATWIFVADMAWQHGVYFYVEVLFLGKYTLLFASTKSSRTPRRMPSSSNSQQHTAHEKQQLTIAHSAVGWRGGGRVGPGLLWPCAIHETTTQRWALASQARVWWPPADSTVVSRPPPLVRTRRSCWTRKMLMHVVLLLLLRDRHGVWLLCLGTRRQGLWSIFQVKRV